MKKILNIPIIDVIPSVEAVLSGQGIPRNKKMDERTVSLAKEAISIYHQKAIPIGIIMEIPKDNFVDIFDGEGKNEVDSPIKSIYQSADDLALFAVTIDEPICSEISVLFKDNDFALGAMLDSAASEGTEMVAQAIENFYRKHLEKIGRFHSSNGIMRFSPGYCGWHISAQKKLFRNLNPENIEITLNSSYLMQPLKSISGVIISGRKEIFEFQDTFFFCKDCATHTCTERIDSLFEHK
jgi:hypothetical protein